MWRHLARGAALATSGWLLSTVVAMAEGLPSFQALVDRAEPNSVLSPPAGTYSGPVVVDKPLEIDGRGEVTIDAGGKGSVISQNCRSGRAPKMRALSPRFGFRLAQKPPTRRTTMVIL